MKLIEQRPEGMLILISAEEVAILNNALNEVCNGVEMPEFQTRIGSSIAEANKLLSAFGAIPISD